MTDPTVAPAPFVPRGWPVRRCLAALLLLAVAFGALWWSGLAAPRLSAASPEITFDRSRGRGTMRIGVHNQGPFAVELRRVTVADDGVDTGPVRVEGPAATGNGEVGGGGIIQLVVDFTCDGRSTWSQRPLRITARTPVGLERDRTVGVFALPNPCWQPETPG